MLAADQLRARGHLLNSTPLLASCPDRVRSSRHQPATRAATLTATAAAAACHVIEWVACMHPAFLSCPAVLQRMPGPVSAHRPLEWSTWTEWFLIRGSSDSRRMGMPEWHASDL